VETKDGILWLLLILLLCILQTCVTAPVYDFIEILKQTDNGVLKVRNQASGALVKEVDITSNYYELGYQIGLIARHINLPLKKRTAAHKDQSNTLTELYNKIYPQHLEKIKGIAAAYGVDSADVDMVYLERRFFVDLGWILFNHNHYWFHEKFPLKNSACSIIGYDVYNGKNHKTIIGRNFDYPYNIPKFLVHTHIKGVYKSVSHTIYALNHWATEGINEKGLFIGETAVNYPKEYPETLKQEEYPDVPAIDVLHLIRIVLDTCTTLDEAIELFESVNIWFSEDGEDQFFIADKNGNMAILVYDRERNLKIIRKDAHKDYLPLTNVAACANKEISRLCFRYKTADEYLSENRINSLNELFRLMKIISFPNDEHPTPLGAEKFEGFQTLWIAMYDLSEKSMTSPFFEDGFSTEYTDNF
jgi:predicted choloylglycine hydrolase